MKIFLMTVLLTISSFAIAEPTVFGLDMGKTTEKQLQDMYDVRHVGMNKYSDGSQYSISPDQISFEGLKKVQTVFNKQGILIAVYSHFNGYKFDYVNEALSRKYQRIDKEQNAMFRGFDQSAVYLTDNTTITLKNSLRDTTLNYINNDFLDSINRQEKLASEAKEVRETSLL